MATRDNISEKNNKKLSDLEAFRSGIWTDDTDEVLEEKLKSMVTTFERGFKSSSADYFSKRDLLELLGGLETMQYEVRDARERLDVAHRRLNELLLKFVPIMPLLTDGDTVVGQPQPLEGSSVSEGK